MKNNPQPANGQIVIFLVFLLAVLLAFMGGIISVGNKSLKNLRMQNAADAAALAGTACLARGLNTMADVAASILNPHGEGGGSLIYNNPGRPFVAFYGGVRAPVEISMQNRGQSVSSAYDTKRLYFDALRYSKGKVINRGEPDDNKAAALSSGTVNTIIGEHLRLIDDAVNQTREEYVGGEASEEFNAKIVKTSQQFAYENGYAYAGISSLEEGASVEEGWQPDWDEGAEKVAIRYSYWKEPPRSGKDRHHCGGFDCGGWCKPCAVKAYYSGDCCKSSILGCKKHWRHCYCKKCWQKKEINSDFPSPQPFWIKGTPRSTEVNVSVQSADGTTRRAKGEITNIRSGSNPDGGQLFPPQSNFKIQLSE